MRAWSCHGRSQRELVNNLATAQIIRSPIVKKVMTLVDRANYVNQRPYDDTPQSIGWSQTISAPHMHAHALELIVPAIEKSQSPTMLDVGCGSGYLTAAMGRMVSDHNKEPLVGDGSGKVYAVDVFPGLVEMTKQNIMKQDADLIQDGTVTVQLGDGWKGLPSAAPFDAIHVGAAADNFPKQLMMQLRVGGVLICPVGPDGGAQVLYRIEKVADNPEFHNEDFRFHELLGVRYVPLLHGRS
jgi:protein-L-isoaspartate(D-aspartate) O-methyltransferase